MTSDTLLWIALIIVVAVIAGVALKRYRNRIFADDAASASPLALLSLESLRDMRDEGAISEEEYERLRARLFREAGAAPKEEDVHRAQPGFDLTGEPLPNVDPEDDQDADSHSGEPP